MKSIPRIVCLSPGGPAGAEVTVAATRAGALGVLDAALSAKASAIRSQVDRVSRVLGARPFALRVTRGMVGEFGTNSPENLAALIVAPGADRRFADLSSSSRLLMAEVTSADEALAAVSAGMTHLIAVGNEAGGWVGDESAFVLLQSVLAKVSPEVRVWLRGGIGLSTASGAIAAGAAGVVLEGALWLARESAVSGALRGRVTVWDGVETSFFPASAGLGFRGFAPHGSAVLQAARETKPDEPNAPGNLESLAGWDEGRLVPAGQDTSFAAELARRFVTIGGIVQAVDASIDEGLKASATYKPLSEASPLALSHGTRYPIVQGPMTRVSDRPAFALEVAKGGGLPFLALALMRGPEVRELLNEAKSALGSLPWGVGLLGFTTPELRAEQTQSVLDARPPFALIAGGRPDQSAVFERQGIATYLHVPSPALLAQFLREGGRRFILEGRECGGHVGPRSSFVLWEQAGRVVENAVGKGIDPSEIHLLYAGGIHDRRSAAAVAALSAPLAAKGVKVGVLVGTAYLFTREATTAGAIVEAYQQETIDCTKTVLLETAPGHQVRVSPTPFTERFEQERLSLIGAGKSAEEVSATLEALNVGRLRVAAKGVDRAAGTGSGLVSVPVESQKAKGLYMLGQVATLRDRVTTIAKLHAEIASASGLANPTSRPLKKPRRRRPRPTDVAIVGMSSILPGAADVQSFWRNTLGGADAITEVPADRWDWKLYYDADPKAPDKITSRWGGFVPDVPFDPLEYGMPPTSLSSIEPLHLLTLEAVKAALADAGYRDRAFPRERTAVILGAGGGAAQLAMGYAFRSYLPLLDTVAPSAGTDALASANGALPEWTEDSFPGILLNVAAGRVANRFDLGGSNMTVDAACGSSLAAAAVAVRELETGAADMVVLGGVDTVQNPFTYLAFSKTQAFSPRGRCRPFDESADGIVISEGVAVVILKRLVDAERDGDRIYAVIKGLGSSSDGRAKGLTAPRQEGQVRALTRAYEKAGISPSTVGYVEAHGTGTAAGDLAELSALRQVLTDSGAAQESCAVGSVKSSIGHTKCAAGLAGLINATLALHHKVFPPTIGVETPTTKAGIEGSPLTLSTSPRPWLKSDPARPRRAGVSAFGFGGTNFHAVLEAYDGSLVPPKSPTLDWPSELFVWRTDDPELLNVRLGQIETALRNGPVPPLRDLARTLAEDVASETGASRLAIVASNPDELGDRISRTRKALTAGETRLFDPSGIAYESVAPWYDAKVAFLFPGQGSQAPGMLSEVALTLPDITRAFEDVDQVLGALKFEPVGPHAFPPPVRTAEAKARQVAALARPDIAQPALAAASIGLVRILESMGVKADVAAGHSFGELVALWYAGVLTTPGLAELAAARGKFLLAAVGDEPGTMAAVQGDRAAVEPLLVGHPGVVIANLNGPKQTVLSGTRDGIDGFVSRASRAGLRARKIPVGCGFHSPLVAGASEPLRKLAERLVQGAPAIPVFANANSAIYESEPNRIAAQIGEHVASPVRFSDLVEATYQAGARVFVEVGPGAVLTGLTGSILGDRSHLAVACDGPGRGLNPFLLSLGRLFAAGVSIDVRPLTAERSGQRIELTVEGFRKSAPKLSASTWIVNGSRARPIDGPEPTRLGPGPALPRPVLSERRHEAKPTEPRQTQSRTQVPPTQPVPAGPLPEGSAAVFEAFQATMQKFLDVQRTAMLGYLGTAQGTPVAAPAAAPSGAPIVPTVRLSPTRPEPPQSPAAPARTADHKNGANGPARYAPPKTPRFGPAEVEMRLVEIVRDRTGYPAEMLKPDLDIEADLGIDSIKRVEIIGTLRESFPVNLNGSESELIDQLARARTLGAIVERVSKALSSHYLTHANAGQPTAGSLRNGHRTGNEANATPIRRMMLEAVDAPFAQSMMPRSLPEGGLVLISDDGRGIAKAAEAMLKSRGFRVVRVAQQEGLRQGNGRHGLAIDFNDAAAVTNLVGQLRQNGRLCGILHLLPLREGVPQHLEPSAWTRKLGPEMRGLYLLARATAEDLQQASRSGGASLVAATALGGRLASVETTGGDFFPGHGGVTGLVKTLAREWDSIRARVVDINPEEDTQSLASLFVDELLSYDSFTEVGYRDGRRIRLRAVESTLDTGNNLGVDLKPGDPILITGGARGITAAVAADLAARWRPTLLLVGTSPLPDEREDPELASITNPAALKSLLLKRLSIKGKPVSPAELERAYQDFRKGQEIRENIRHLRALGSTVEYAQVDVRDTQALGTQIAEWQQRHGPLAGFIHGAGVIQDKLLRDKTPESFDRVIATKLDGALNLARLVDNERLKFAAFFSSVAGRFGNGGQVDYAAANDILNKLAIWLDQRWAARVVSMIWGPWSGVGMVSDLQGHLGRRGLGMIDPEEGRSRLGDELQFGRKGEVEIIIAGDLGNMVTEPEAVTQP